MKLLLRPKNIYASVLTLLLLFAFTFTSQAHCDRVNGPVATDARKALENENVTQALIWVAPEQEEELSSVFEQSLAVYKKGGESRELAEQYFMETTVRLHREAEDMPFTGLKSAQPNPVDIQQAENALESGDLAPVTDLLAQEIQDKTAKLFADVMEAEKRKYENIETGRNWVDSYVKYIVYIHSLHQTIQAGPSHGIDNN